MHHQIIMPAVSGMCYALGSNDFTIYSIRESVRVHSYMSNLRNASVVLDDVNSRLFVVN
jgi:hypothetical protein